MKVIVPINGCLLDFKLTWHSVERFAERALGIRSYDAFLNKERLLKKIRLALSHPKSIEWRAGGNDIRFITNCGIFVANNRELSIVTFQNFK